MTKITKIFILLLILANLGCNQNKKKEMEYQDKKLKSGQIWEYNTRKGEEKSRVFILKVEKSKKDEIIVHISVVNARIKNPRIDGGISKEIGHLPFSRKAVIESITELESSDNKMPDYEDGYNQWKEAYNNGKGGIFTISVKEAIDYVEQTMN